MDFPGYADDSVGSVSGKAPYMTQALFRGTTPQVKRTVHSRLQQRLEEAEP